MDTGLAPRKNEMAEQYNQDYYENGVKAKLSGYENYHWMPTRSYPEAIEIVSLFPAANTIIDFGAAKGFLVHALNQLGRAAFGEDISDYALANCHPRVEYYMSKPSGRQADLIICKDMLEHVPADKIVETLQFLKSKCLQHLFLVIPLGDNDVFRIREYEMDLTHVTKKDEDWWIDKIHEAGLELEKFDYSCGAIKEKWIPVHPHGNGFFVCRPK